MSNVNVSAGLRDLIKDLGYFQGTVKQFAELYRGQPYMLNDNFTRCKIYKTTSELFRKGCFNGTYETSGWETKNLYVKHGIRIKVIKENGINKIYRAVHGRSVGVKVMEMGFT